MRIFYHALLRPVPPTSSEVLSSIKIIKSSNKKDLGLSSQELVVSDSGKSINFPSKRGRKPSKVGTYTENKTKGSGSIEKSTYKGAKVSVKKSRKSTNKVKQDVLKTRIRQEREFIKKFNFLKEHTLYFLNIFVNSFMLNGKKGRAEKILKETFFLLQKREKMQGLKIFFKALANVKPEIEVRSVRRGGASYQIPVPLGEKRSLSMAVKWLVSAAKKKGKAFSLNLCNVLIEASKKQGEAVKKCEVLHSTAFKNRSLTQYRWY